MSIKILWLENFDLGVIFETSFSDHRIMGISVHGCCERVLWAYLSRYKDVILHVAVWAWAWLFEGNALGYSKQVAVGGNAN